MHIDTPAFDSKSAMYAHIAEMLDSATKACDDRTANLANASALLNLFLDRINWVGFYLMRGNVLILGPFQGKPAVTEIVPPNGVCGLAAASRETQRVDDVHVCTNHIVCDAASASEIVVPILRNGEVLGVLDIDSPVTARFDDEDRAGLERFVEILARNVF